MIDLKPFNNVILGSSKYKWGNFWEIISASSEIRNYQFELHPDYSNCGELDYNANILSGAGFLFDEEIIFSIQYDGIMGHIGKDEFLLMQETLNSYNLFTSTGYNLKFSVDRFQENIEVEDKKQNFVISTYSCIPINTILINWLRLLSFKKIREPSFKIIPNGWKGVVAKQKFVILGYAILKLVYYPSDFSR